jgi:hypothetical protein
MFRYPGYLHILSSTWACPKMTHRLILSRLDGREDEPAS